MFYSLRVSTARHTVMHKMTYSYVGKEEISNMRLFRDKMHYAWRGQENISIENTKICKQYERFP